jgi:hypothetical protein
VFTQNIGMPNALHAKLIGVMLVIEIVHNKG